MEKEKLNLKLIAACAIVITFSLISVMELNTRSAAQEIAPAAVSQVNEAAE